MAIIMTKTVKGSANQYGNETRMYNEGEEIVIDAPWKQTLVDNFLAAIPHRECPPASASRPLFV